MDKTNKKEAGFKISPNEPSFPISALAIPWQAVDIKTGNCPRHVGVRLNRVNDDLYLCPKGKEQYVPHGSMTNQTNKDNYYLGIILKGPSIHSQPGKV